MAQKGIVFVISAPSGAGKQTVIRRSQEEGVSLATTISATTRPPRSTETDGHDYYFLSMEDFQKRVAENAFLLDLDLVLGGRVASSGQDDFMNLDWRRARWNAGFDIDLPFERTAERNAYRRSLINHERALRAYSLAMDNIKLEVREGWRDLEEARRNYAVAEKSVDLNRRRVKEQELLAELGRATAQNQVDAQNDLINAQNDLTSAIVKHNNARLQFWRDMGILFIKEDGQWEEIRDE